MISTSTILDYYNYIVVMTSKNQILGKTHGYLPSEREKRPKLVRNDYFPCTWGKWDKDLRNEFVPPKYARNNFSGDLVHFPQ